MQGTCGIEILASTYIDWSVKEIQTGKLVDNRYDFTFIDISDILVKCYEQ